MLYNYYKFVHDDFGVSCDAVCHIYEKFYFKEEYKLYTI